MSAMSNMRKVAVAVLVGMLVGALAGALILGVDQYFRERHESDWSEIEQWVSVAMMMGASLGAAVGAAIGFVVGLVKRVRLS